MGEGCSQGGEKRQGSQHPLRTAGSLKQGPTLRRLCNTAPWGPERRLCPGLFLPETPVWEREWKDHLSEEAEADIGQEEPSESCHNLPCFSPSPPHMSFRFTSLSNWPTSSHPNVPTLVQTTCGSWLGLAPGSSPAPAPSPKSLRKLSNPSICPSLLNPVPPSWPCSPQRPSG